MRLSPQTPATYRQSLTLRPSSAVGLSLSAECKRWEEWRECRHWVDDVCNEMGCTQKCNAWVTVRECTEWTL